MQNPQRASNGQKTSAESLSDKLAELQNLLAEKPSSPLEQLALQYGLPVSRVIEQLPTGNWQKMDGRFYIDILKLLPDLGKITLIINSSDVIFEFSGEFPRGGSAHGYYNLSMKSPLHGHLKTDRCSAIYLVKRDFMGMATISLQFANPEGSIMFKVFAGRDEKRALLPQQVAAFEDWFTNGLPAEGKA